MVFLKENIDGREKSQRRKVVMDACGALDAQHTAHSNTTKLLSDKGKKSMQAMTLAEEWKGRAFKP